MKGSNLRRKNKLSLKLVVEEKTKRGIPPRPPKVAVSTECTVSNAPTVRNKYSFSSVTNRWPKTIKFMSNTTMSYFLPCFIENII